LAKFSGLVSTNKKPLPVQYFNIADLRVRATAVLAKENRFTYTGEELSTFPLNKRIELGFSEMSLLKNDWDTYSAIAPSKSAIDVAKELCSLFPPRIQPEIYPENDGSVGLYWDFESILCMKLKSNDDFVWFIEDANGNQTSSQGHTVEQIASAIRAHIEKNLKK